MVSDTLGSRRFIETECAMSKAAPGEARAPGPSLQELLKRDDSSVPAPLQAESYEFLGDDDIPYSNYTSKVRLEAEFENLWPRVWQWACREEHIPEAGDYYVYDIGHLSAVIVRTGQGEVKAFYNACMHRGTQLKAPASCGYAENFRCPFHGWIYSLDGKLLEVPEKWDFPHVSAETHSLREVHVGLWSGFVFVNFDVDAEPLDAHLGTLTSHFANLGIEDRYIETHVQKRLPCNWKAAAESFMEAYHVRETHAGGMPGAEVTTQYDVFGETVTRFIHTIGSPNPRVNPPQTEQELLGSMWARGHEWDDTPCVPKGMTARDFYADHLKRTLGDAYGQDFSHYPTCMTLDSIEYFLFPNAFFFPGLSLPMVYRFRPDAIDPDFCTFDLMMLRPVPPDGKPPPPPEPVQLDVDDSYTAAEGLGRLGAIYDEDTGNMAAQTRGFKTSRKLGQTLGNYQEVRIRHLQQRVNKYLNVEI